MPMFRRNVVSSSSKTKILEQRYHVPSKSQNHLRLFQSITLSTQTMRKREIAPITLPFGMQLRRITMLFYQKSKANFHKVAKKILCILYVYSRIYTVQAPCTSSMLERTFVKLYKKVSWCLEVHKDKYRMDIKSESYPYTGLDRPLVLKEVEARRISR